MYYRLFIAKSVAVLFKPTSFFAQQGPHKMAITIKLKTLHYPRGMPYAHLKASRSLHARLCTSQLGEGMIRLICLDCNRNALKGFIQHILNVGHFRSASWNVCFFTLRLQLALVSTNVLLPLKTNFEFGFGFTRNFFGRKLCLSH